MTLSISKPFHILLFLKQSVTNQIELKQGCFHTTQQSGLNPR